MNKSLLEIQKNETLKRFAAELGIPVIEVHMDNSIDTMVKKPISKEEWDAKRINSLKHYIMESLLAGKTIDAQIINEYNSLIKK